MIVLAILTFLVLALCAGFLLYRLVRVQWMAHRVISKGLGSDPLAASLRRFLGRSVDQRLLAQAKAGGLADVEVRLREQWDRYRTAAELLEFLARTANGPAFDGQLNAIKGLYQLQYALGMAPSDVEECVQAMVLRLKTIPQTGRRVGRAESVPPGALLDLKTMMSLDYGTRVKQPLGVIVYDEDGKVMSKAKVTCS